MDISSVNQDRPLMHRNCAAAVLIFVTSKKVAFLHF